MRKSLLISAVLMAGVAGGALRASAAGLDPQVIPGIGPEADIPVAAAQLRNPQPRPVRVAARQSGGEFGGGFIELLMTGAAPGPQRGSVGYNRPPEPALQQAPMVRAAPVARQYQASYAQPPAAAPMAVQRAIDPMFERQEVAYSGPHAPGTLVVDTPKRFLFLVLPNGRALRYGIGVGRPGFEWAGVKTVSRKAEWPDWRPPSEMLKRRPDLPAFMKGGPENPLGARALYLGSSLYRIHGTNEPHTIGQNVSSGCIRMMNEDVTDLYSRVKVGSKVIVI